MSGKLPAKEATAAVQSAVMADTTERIFNFNAGPAVLPLPALEEARRDLLSLPGVGMSVLEISHRSKTFEEILAATEADLRALLNLPGNYKVLFLGGGASLQFSMVPMNLLPPNGSADYIVTGRWSERAVKEAKKLGRPLTSASADPKKSSEILFIRLGGKVRIAASTEADKFTRVPRQDELKLDPQAAYVHYTSNNTIYGTAWPTEPQVGNVPLVCDASSDILSRALDVGKYALIYAGAQKNVGAAGVTLIILRDDLLARVPAGLPAMLDYKLQAEKKSLYNTPPVFAIYLVGLVLKWMRQIGGLAEVERRNRAKAELLYNAIDSSGGYYRGTAEKESRSRMNLTFRLPSEELEAKFVKEASAQGLAGLKGHRSVGGLRASLYNAFPLEGVQALVAFMKAFQQGNG